MIQCMTIDTLVQHGHRQSKTVSKELISGKANYWPKTLEIKAIYLIDEKRRKVFTLTIITKPKYDYKKNYVSSPRS